jgi:hypothetical protein
VSSTAADPVRKRQPLYDRGREGRGHGLIGRLVHPVTTAHEVARQSSPTSTVAPLPTVVNLSPSRPAAGSAADASATGRACRVYFPSASTNSAVVWVPVGRGKNSSDCMRDLRRCFDRPVTTTNRHRKRKPDFIVSWRVFGIAGRSSGKRRATCRLTNHIYIHTLGGIRVPLISIGKTWCSRPTSSGRSDRQYTAWRKV